MPKLYHIKLTADERADFQNWPRKEKAAAIKVKRAKAMLAMDCSEDGPAKSDEAAARISGIPIPSLERLRKRVCEVGPIGALERKARETPPIKPKVTAEVEARMVQIACTRAPEGSSRWTMQMIADRLVELEIVESISDETVRIILKKNEVKPWQQQCWCIPPLSDAAFVAQMEDVLDVYQMVPEPKRPLVCLDEFCLQLLSEITAPLAARPATSDAPGTAQRYHVEYVREGSASAFMLAAPRDPRGFRRARWATHGVRLCRLHQIPVRGDVCGGGENRSRSRQPKHP